MFLLYKQTIFPLNVNFLIECVRACVSLCVCVGVCRCALVCACFSHRHSNCLFIIWNSCIVSSSSQFNVLCILFECHTLAIDLFVEKLYDDEMSMSCCYRWQVSLSDLYISPVKVWKFRINENHMAFAVSYNPSLRSTGKRTAWVGKVLKKHIRKEEEKQQRQK